MSDDYTYPQHDWSDPNDELEAQFIQTAENTIPHVSEGLIKALRERREWQNRCPDPSWSDKQIQQNIGANAVIEHMERLLEQQRSAPVK